MPLLVRFLRDSRAATSIEYALIAALICLVIVAGVTAVGTRLQSKFFGPVANGLS